MIGTISAISGDYSSIGIDSQRGVELAIEEKDNILGHPITLLRYGTDCSADNARVAATELAADPHLVAVLGPTCSEEVQSIAPVLLDAGINILSPSLGEIAFFFPDDELPSTVAPLRATYPSISSNLSAEFAVEKVNAQHIITIDDSTNNSSEQTRLFTTSYQALAGKSSLQIIGAYKVPEVQNFLSAITKNTPDLIYIAASPVSAGQVVAQIRATPGWERVAILGSEGLFTSAFLQYAGEAARGVYLLGPDIATFSSNYPRLTDSYELKYDQIPLSLYYVYTYEASELLSYAIGQTAVRDRDGTLHLPRLGLRQSISRIRNYPGVTGMISCDNPINCTPDPHFAIYQIVSAAPASWNPGINPKRIYP